MITRTQSFILIDSKNKLDNEQIIGRILAKSVYDPTTKKLVALANTHITVKLLNIFEQNLQRPQSIIPRNVP